MRFIFLVSSLIAVASLSACATPNHTPPVVEEKPVEVPVPVATGCIAKGGRPALPTPLRDQVTIADWQKRATGAKAESLRAQVGTRMNYVDLDRASTSACK